MYVYMSTDIYIYLIQIRAIKNNAHALKKQSMNAYANPMATHPVDNQISTITDYHFASNKELLPSFSPCNSKK